MKVKWTEAPSMYIDPWDPPDISEEIYIAEATHYSGEVMGTNSSFWSGDTLTVMCDDGKIRKVAINKVTKC